MASHPVINLFLRASVLRRGAAFFRQSFGAWNVDKDVPILCKRERLARGFIIAQEGKCRGWPESQREGGGRHLAASLLAAFARVGESCGGTKKGRDKRKTHPHPTSRTCYHASTTRTVGHGIHVPSLLVQAALLGFASPRPKKKGIAHKGHSTALSYPSLSLAPYHRTRVLCVPGHVCV